MLHRVGQTPQGWNGSIFSMIDTFHRCRLLAYLAIVMTLEPVFQMITDLDHVDTWMIFNWVFKSAAAILLVTNTLRVLLRRYYPKRGSAVGNIIGSDASITSPSVMTDTESG